MALSSTMASVIALLLSPMAIPAFVLVSCLLYVSYNLFVHPLRNVPGPWYAAASPFYLLFTYFRGHQHLDMVKLHTRYGPIVRIEPNNILINSPDLFPAYFGFDKAVWWRAFRADPYHVSHSNTLNMSEHKAAKKRVTAAYQMSAVLKDEHKMDKHIRMLERQFKNKVGEVFDVAPWAVWLASDIVMDMAFSQPFGFLEAAYDIDDVLGSIQNLIGAGAVMATFPIFSAILMIPWIHKLVAPKPTDATGPGRVHGIAFGQVRKRFQLLKDTREKPGDVLQRIIDKTNAEGEHLPKEQIDQEALDPVIAGSDSTASQIRAAILYLSTHPRVLEKLRAEIDAAESGGYLSPIAQYNEIKRHIPYMELIQNELMRIYPIVGSPSPREAPQGGVTMHKYYIPAGTDVSLSHWGVARNPNIWGDDVDSFRPERWEYSNSGLGDANDRDFDEKGFISEASKKTSVDPTTYDEFVRHMRTTGHVFFSSGNTLCTGRNIAMMELYKVIIHLFRTFDFQVVNPTKPWKELCLLGMFHSDFWVVVEERQR